MRLINQFSLHHLPGDLSGGITAAVVALPMALAFGVASGAGPLAGLYGAVCVGLFAAVFGGTPTLISEPTGPMTVVMTAVVTGMVASDPESGLAKAFTVVMIAGLFQIALGAFRLGRYITLMPYSVISGFMSGIGVILVILQLAPLLGHPPPGGGVPATLMALPRLIADPVPAEVGLGIVTVAVLFALPRRWRRILPPPLVALVVGTVVSFLLTDVDPAVQRIGPIPMGLPHLQTPALEPAVLTRLVLDGFVLGMLGCVDSILTAMIADSLTRTQHDSNRELIGQGLGNLVSGLAGGLPGAGATMGTVVNIQAGARTAVSGVARAGLLLIVVLWAAPLTAHIPLAVLAGIALKVGIDILDWSFLKRAHHVSRTATLLMYGVMLLTVLVDLIVAVGIGVFIANIITIDRLSRVQAERLRVVSDADDAVQLTAAERDLLDQGAGRVLLFHLTGPMIFGVAKAIAREQAAMAGADALIVDLTDVPMMDVTVALAIENVIRDALAGGTAVYLVAPDSRSRTYLDRMGVLLGDRLYPDRGAALLAAVSALPPERANPA